MPHEQPGRGGGGGILEKCLKGVVAKSFPTKATCYSLKLSEHPLLVCVNIETYLLKPNRIKLYKSRAPDKS